MPTAERPPSFDPKANIEAGVAWAREHYSDALDQLGEGVGYVGGKRFIRSEHGPEINIESVMISDVKRLILNPGDKIVLRCPPRDNT